MKFGFVPVWTKHIVEYSAVLCAYKPIRNLYVESSNNGTSVVGTSKSTWCAKAYVASELMFSALSAFVASASFILILSWPKRGLWYIRYALFQRMQDSFVSSSQFPPNSLAGRHFLLRSLTANHPQIVSPRHLALSPAYRSLGQCWNGVMYCGRPSHGRFVQDSWWIGAYLCGVWMAVQRLPPRSPHKNGCSSLNDLATSLDRNDGIFWRFLKQWWTHTAVWWVICRHRWQQSCCSLS